MKPNTPEMILARHVVMPDGCWLWTGTKTNDGYGAVSYAGRTHPAHRLYWHFLRGPVPKGMVPDHLCRVKSCVNPEHLEIVTYAENNRRARSTRPVTKRNPGQSLNSCYKCSDSACQQCATVAKSLDKYDRAPLAQWQSNGLLKPAWSRPPERCRS